MEEPMKEVTEMQEPGRPVRNASRYFSDQLGILMLIILFLAAGIAGILFLNLAFISIKSPSPVFFAATEQEQLFQEPPLNVPGIKTNILLNWVTEAMMSVHTFNFMSYARVIANSEQYFTKEGYENYKAALQNLGILQRVLDDKAVMVAEASAAPQITKEGVLANRYLWKIRANVLLTYKNVSGTNYDEAEIILLVMRLPTLNSPLGIRILKYDMTLKRGVELGPR